MIQRALKTKKETLEDLLQGQVVFVHVITTFKGLEIPAHLKSTETVTLQLSHYFRGKMIIHEDIIDADLLFGSQYHKCVIPIDAIIAMSDAENNTIVWDEKSTINPQHSETIQNTTPTPSTTVKEPKASHLRRVK